ncbi:hypothetical protein [Nocardia pneumoniae]|uniref:hypothetical protein n=1 Tax=Nocardia pneumoniae TaxID=228601 RepID=UPI0002EC9A3D|nr:hypothetical protein [Nocardia pneumoniae]
MPRTILYPSDEQIRITTARLLDLYVDSAPVFFGLTLVGPDRVGVMPQPILPTSEPPIHDLSTLIFSRAPRATLWGFGYRDEVLAERDGGSAEAMVAWAADARGNMWKALQFRDQPDADPVVSFRPADEGRPDEEAIMLELWVAALALAAI